MTDKPFGCECGQWYATSDATLQCFLSHYTKEKSAYLLAACEAGFTMKQAKFLWTGNTADALKGGAPEPIPPCRMVNGKWTHERDCFPGSRMCKGPPTDALKGGGE